ncbi:G8 domain-containing protein [Anatilimnocola sp. NA78]|uniref:G8 domain-containing protein n=1 Tax=Anatilimnocola sp. NA78 TaxID=3415683 RepID=UPI003CE52BB3
MLRRICLASLCSFAISAFCLSVVTAADVPVIQSVATGNWSAAATWKGGKVPGSNVKVQILPGHTVTYDIKAADDLVIRSVHIAGTLRFDPAKKTRLNVGLIKIQDSDDTEEEGFDCEGHVSEPEPGKARPALLVGTPAEPIATNAHALIRLTMVEGLNKESCPAIVCCGGRMDFHGQPMSRTWVKLGETAAKGATQVTLAEPVSGWRVGDRLILTPTQNDYGNEPVTEQRVITAIDGTTVKFAEALEHKHLGEGETRGEVGNLSRNVIVESADPAGERGHTMYHRFSQGSISYAEFRHLGKKNVLGRYALHFHLIGNTMRGSYVQGASIWDSHNRWLTIHGTNYLVVRDNVGFGSVGHGYFFEDGTEVFNVLDRNLAVGAVAGKRLPKQVLPFDQNEGAGFWWANSLNTFTRNVAAGNDRYGFRYEATESRSLKLSMPVLQPDGSEKVVDIRTLPFVRFEDNEVHSNAGLYGINLGEGVNRVGPDERHPFVVRNTKIWDVHYGFRPQVPSLLIENLSIQSHYGIYHPNFDRHEYRNLSIKATNTEPFNRGHDDDSVQHGVVTVDGLTFDSMRSGGMPLIQISDDNPTGKAASHFRGVKTTNWNDNSKSRALVNLGGGPRPVPKTEKGVPIYLHDHYGPGRHAMVVSTRSPEYKAEPDSFRKEPPLTGNESAVKEVSNLPFPKVLDPVDDLPPATVITHVIRQDGKLIVRGTCSDNGEVKQVVVNGEPAKSAAANFSEWEVSLSGTSTKLAAHAIDAAGNQEKLTHEVLAP